MKNTIKAGKFLKMFKDSRLKSDYPHLYKRYYDLIEALIRGFEDYTIEGLSSLEGLTDKNKFDSFLRFDILDGKSTEEKDREVENKLSAIFAEVKTWHDKTLQSIKDRLNQDRDAVEKKIDGETISKWTAFVSAIFTLALGPVALHFGMSHDEIAFYITGGSAIITLVVSAIAGIRNLTQNKKFSSTYGISIGEAKNLIITEEEYKIDIKKAQDLYHAKNHRGNIRKAKRIYNKLLKRDSTDPNCFVGLLAIQSNNFTKYSDKRKEDNLIEDIEKSKGDDNYSRLNAAYKEDYLKYKREKVDAYKENRDETLREKKLKHRKCIERAIPILQQIGIYTVLILPIIFSIAVIVLTYSLPVKSFDDYTGWLYIIVFAVDCLSALALVIMMIALSIADRNPNFNGSGVGEISEYVFLTGLGAGIFIMLSVFWGIFQWWQYFLLYGFACLYLFCIMWGFIKHEGKSIPRFLIFCLVGISLGIAVGCATVSFKNFTESVHDYYTENSDGTYTYVICNDETENLEIPSEYCGSPVTAVKRDEAIELSHLKSVYIPDSVTTIEENIFSGCSRLTSITVPYVGYLKTYSVENYDGEAESMAPIGYLFGTTEYDGGVATKQSLWGKYISGDRAGEESTFNRTYYIPASLKKVTVLGGEVCYGAFYGCANLESVTLGDDVTSIDKYAFLDCGAVHKKGGISYIDKWVVGCDRTVSEVDLPRDTIGIADCAFMNCESLTFITLNEWLKVIGDSVFQKTKITSLTIPQSVSVIGANAFSGCSLSDVVFENIEEWYVDGIYVPSSDLTDSSKASKYLTFTYVGYRWKRG